MIVLELSAEAVANTRFAWSPAEEALRLTRALALGRSTGLLDDDCVQARRRLRGLEVQSLVDTLTGSDYFPDFLSPAPQGRGNEFESQLRAMRSTAPGQVDDELRRSFADREAPRPTGNAADVRDQLIDELRRCHDALLQPWMSRIEAVARTDLAGRREVMSDRGVSAAINTLHASIHAAGNRVTFATDSETRTRDVADSLVLVPTVLGERRAGLLVEPLDAPAQIVYPARGSGLLYERMSTVQTPLDALIGTTRRDLLVATESPTTTTDLAAIAGLAPSTVSNHLTAMAAVGWLTRRRVGRKVLYQLSDLGRSVMDGSASGPRPSRG